MNYLLVFVIMAITFFVLLLILLKFPRFFLILNVFLLITGILIYTFFRTESERWLIENIGRTVTTIESGNQFSVGGLMFSKRSLMLADTELPPAKEASLRAKEALTNYIKGKHVKLTFVSSDKNEPEPWKVRVRLKEQDINRLMVKEGYISGTAKLPRTTEPYKEKRAVKAEREDIISPKRSFWMRIFIWSVIGFIGASTLGQTLAARKSFAIYFLTIIVISIIYCGVKSYQQDISIIPPIIALIIIILFGGVFKSAAVTAKDIIQSRSR